MGLLDFLKPRDKTASVQGAYVSIVKQARRPELYAPGCAPDNFDGRFDMMALHVHLVLRRMRALGMGRSDIGQDLFDMFFKDMDQAMREAGVGDMGVGKKCRKWSKLFMAARPLMTVCWTRKVTMHKVTMSRARMRAAT